MQLALGRSHQDLGEAFMGIVTVILDVGEESEKVQEREEEKLQRLPETSE